MLYKIIKILLIIILSSCYGYGQIQQDSLNKLLENKSNIEKIDILNKLAEQNINKSAQNSFEYAKLALEISNEINNVNWKINSAINAGKALKKQKQFSKSISYYNIIFDIYYETNNKAGLAYYYNETGNIYKDWGKYEKAIEEYKKALNIYIKTNDSKNKYLMHNNIANTYLKLNPKNHKKAGEHYLLAYKIIENSTDNKEKVIVLNKIGACYGNWGNYKEALKYLKKAQEIAKANKYTQLNASITENIKNIEFNLENKETVKTEYEDEKEELQEQYISSITEENLEVKRRNLKSLEEIEKLSFKNQAKELKLIVLQDKYEKQLLENKIKEQNIKLLNTEIKLEKTKLNKKTEKIKTQKIIITLLIIGALLIILIILLIFKARQNKQKLKFQKEQLKAIIDIQEEERIRFARDVHDGIGQFFFALKLNISQLDNDNLSNEQKIETYKKTMEIINDLQQEIRNISFSIMPQMLHYKGLMPALEELTDKINKLGKIQIELDVFEFHERLNSQMEVALYRITQELINNILKHSKASNINIQFTRHEDELNIMIEDNGAGYNTKLLENSKGHGWKNINSRLEMINGKINIDSQTDRKGTTTIINIPLKKMTKV